eukprot:scaffold21738_cov129-Isochrysis_galbana.AAC.2
MHTVQWWVVYLPKLRTAPLLAGCAGCPAPACLMPYGNGWMVQASRYPCGGRVLARCSRPCVHVLAQTPQDTPPSVPLDSPAATPS